MTSDTGTTTADDDHQHDDDQAEIVTTGETIGKQPAITRTRATPRIT